MFIRGMNLMTKCRNCDYQFKTGENATIVDNGIVHSYCYDTWKNKAAGYKYTCVKCKGLKKQKHATQTYKKEVPLEPGESPECAWNDCRGCGGCRTRTKVIEVPSMVDCDLCNGRGYTKEEYEPILEPKIVGYKKK